MSGTNAYCTFDFCGFDRFKGDGFPKGDLLRIAANPHNGLVVLSYQDGDKAFEVADCILAQISQTVDDIRDFLCPDGGGEDFGLRQFASYCKGDISINRFDACPFCGGVPDYVDDCIVCCDGRLVMHGFDSLADAVCAWNSRSAFVRKAS